MQWLRRLVVLLAATAAASGSAAHAQGAPAADPRLERMVSLGRLWATVKYFHPYLASRSIDWDSALVATVPRAQASTTRAQFVEAIEGMLAALSDPATRVAPERPAVSQASDPDPHCRMLPGRTDRAHVPAAAFYRMQPMPRDTADRTVIEDVQTLPTALGPRYRGATVMLIDERTQSQAEHTGLFFKAANGTLFVGTPTSGADGDVVSFTVPGGITLTFSGQGVTWPDGRQLQRVGLKPDVVVRPTVAGIRAGRDEVLDRAVAWVRANLPEPVVRSP